MGWEQIFKLRQGSALTVDALEVGGRTVPLLVVRNPRARRYLLRLRPDGKARVTIPRGGDETDALAFANRNAEWLKTQLERLATQPQTPAAWRLGTEIWLRGERVRIMAAEDCEIYSLSPDVRHLGPGAEDDVCAPHLIRPAAELTPSRPLARPEGLSTRRTPSAVSQTAEVSPEQRRETGRRGRIVVGSERIAVANVDADLRPEVERHLWRCAKMELPRRVQELSAQHGISVSRVSVRNQRSRWGSCSRRGTISLNWRLIQTPDRVRDYIILHELAHRRHMNHSARFWQEVDLLCPNYLEAERWLKEHGKLMR
jgi:predicted metal-dependent hydrolase